MAVLIIAAAAAAVAAAVAVVAVVVPVDMLAMVDVGAVADVVVAEAAEDVVVVVGRRCMEVFEDAFVNRVHIYMTHLYN